MAREEAIAVFGGSGNTGREVISAALKKGLRVRAAPAIRIGRFTSVRRADLAQFPVDEVTAGRWHRQAVRVVA